jgi:hypothetical protein
MRCGFGSGMTFSAVSYVRLFPNVIALSDARATPNPFSKISCEVMKARFLNRKLTIYVGCIYVKGFLGVPGPVNCVTDVEFGLFEERDNRLDSVCPRTRAGSGASSRRIVS